MKSLKPTSVYLHYPYCKSKCSYCAFNKYDAKSTIPHFSKTIQKELKSELEKCPKRIETVYFGGGTPSLASPDFVANTIETLSENADTDFIKEITLEANPTDLELGKLKAFKDAGITRLSLGVQALQKKDLMFFNRDHSVDDAIQGIHKALDIFPKNTSLDFVWGRPGQTLKDWSKELEKIISFDATHLSLYQLTVERGTKLYKQVHELKSIEMPNDDQMANFFEMTRSKLEHAGYEQYEISSFSKSKQYQSQHNLGYWNGRDYLGIGPGAHQRVDGKRTFRIPSPVRWADQVQSSIGHGIAKTIELTNLDFQKELILVGLRQSKGIDSLLYTSLTGNILENILDHQELELMIERKLLLASYDAIGNLTTLKCTYKGLALADRIALQIIQ